MDTNEKRLEDVFKDVFEDEHFEITESMVIKEINGWDSLLHISLMAAVQDEFGITFSIDDIAKTETVGDILERLKNHD